MFDTKLVSIVLAVKNEAGSIEAMLDSCFTQTWQKLELIVIDSNSDDGTKEVLSRHSDHRLSWISENDSGIYDAWNKALSKVTGNFICFVGADDLWASSESLERMVNLADAHTDLVCAQFSIRKPDGSLSGPQGQQWSWEAICRDMVVCHRGLLHNRRLFDNHGQFDASFRIAGDYEFLLRCGSNLKAAYLDEVTILAGGDGISFTSPFASLSERQRAQDEHNVSSRWSSAFQKWFDYFFIISLKMAEKILRPVLKIRNFMKTRS